MIQRKIARTEKIMKKMVMMTMKKKKKQMMRRMKMAQILDQKPGQFQMKMLALEIQKKLKIRHGFGLSSQFSFAVSLLLLEFGCSSRKRSLEVSLKFDFYLKTFINQSCEWKYL